MVDNTFSPVMLSPALHGADVIVHSLTKFVSGASDIIAGVFSVPARDYPQLPDVGDDMDSMAVGKRHQHSCTTSR